MKKLFLSIVCSISGIASFAKDGYRIEIKFKQDIKDSFVYLAHAYAKPLPDVYKIDSGRVVNKRTVVIDSKDSVLGGMYMILFHRNSQLVNIILNNGDHFSMNVDTTDIPGNTMFSGSDENTRFNDYEKFLTVCGKKQHDLTDALKKAKTATDTQSIRNKGDKLNDEVHQYWTSYSAKYPHTFLGSFFNASQTPQTPEGKHYLNDGKTEDTTFAYRYYKQHYWDKFDFSDNRLINAPLYDGKLNEYFNRLVFPVPDSANVEADYILGKTRASKELFKYTLQWLAGNTYNSKIMGMDEAFIHLVENYYMKGDAYWMDSASLAKYENLAKKIAPNVLGNTAPDLTCQDIWTLKDKKLSEVQSKYTLAVFWSTECGHCLKEIPLLDSAYNTTLKKKGITVYSLITNGGTLSDIQKKVKELKLDEWVNVVDAEATTGYKDKYDVYTTPKIYLLDENKKIIGKGLDHSNILEVMEFNERKKAKNNQH